MEDVVAWKGWPAFKTSMQQQGTGSSCPIEVPGCLATMWKGPFGGVNSGKAFGNETGIGRRQGSESLPFDEMGLSFVEGTPFGVYLKGTKWETAMFWGVPLF